MRRLKDEMEFEAAIDALRSPPEASV